MKAPTTPEGKRDALAILLAVDIARENDFDARRVAPVVLEKMRAVFPQGIEREPMDNIHASPNEARLIRELCAELLES
jgi:hypothetical protein